MSILTLRDIIYSYPGGTSNVLNGINYQFEKGTFYAIVGSSGAGKSTLLGLLAGLDTPTGGQILFDDQDIAEQGYSHHRKHNISLVFQNYNLIDYLTPLENLKLVNPKATNETLHAMGLDDDHINRNVMKLSGGQQQRVAIGRALVSHAPIILADEPTGNLDETTAADIIDILRRAAHENDKCVIVVTHSKQLAKEADVVLKLKDKTLQQERRKRR
jgi:putative ABC transport system ATP-binding protein